MTSELEARSYGELLETLKKEITTARIRAHLAVNKEMICFIGRLGSRFLNVRKKKGGVVRL